MRYLNDVKYNLKIPRWDEQRTWIIEYNTCDFYHYDKCIFASYVACVL